MLLRGMTWLVFFQLLGTGLNVLVLPFLPGPIIGMLLMVVYLCLRGGVSESISLASSGLLTYLPLMILPLYAVMIRLEDDLLDAAADLGASRAGVFMTVILPLTLPGIVAGSLLVFIPAVGEFVIPALLGGPEQIMVGKVLWTEFFRNRDWPVASAIAMLLLAILALPIIYARYQDGRETALDRADGRVDGQAESRDGGAS